MIESLTGGVQSGVNRVWSSGHEEGEYTATHLEGNACAEFHRAVCWSTLPTGIDSSTDCIHSQTRVRHSRMEDIIDRRASLSDPRERRHPHQLPSINLPSSTISEHEPRYSSLLVPVPAPGSPRQIPRDGLRRGRPTRPLSSLGKSGVSRWGGAR